MLLMYYEKRGNRLLASFIFIPLCRRGGMMKVYLQGKRWFTSMHRWVQIASELVTSPSVDTSEGLKNSDSHESLWPEENRVVMKRGSRASQNSPLNVSRCVYTDAAGILLPFGYLGGKTWNYWNWNRLISTCSCCSNTPTVSAWKISRRLEEKSHKVNKRSGWM